MPEMPKKRPKLNKNKRVRAIARERVGVVPPAQVFDDKRAREKAKHKKNFAHLAPDTF